MLVLLVAHGLAGAVAPWLVRVLGRRAFAVLALVPLATGAWALLRAGDVLADGEVVERVTWVPSIGLELALRVDTLSWLMVLVVGLVGAGVFAYCAAYFDDDEPGLGRFAGVLTAFAGAMLGLVVSDDMLVLYVFWELTTVFSFLLIGHLTTSVTSRTVATQALVVTASGGLAMLVGLVLLGQAAGTYRLSEVVPQLASGELGAGPAIQAAVLLVLVGALSKSALFPFHFWLPGAMAAPTPVSAYLHAAAMVKAGIYLVARFAPAAADLPVWRPTLLVLGAVTLLLGGWQALRQTDLKLLLAYGTVSQLGLLVLLVGLGTQDAALAGVTMLVSHALFKACLFLVVGVVDHSTGTRDLRRLSGLRRSQPLLAVVAGLALASMAGVPPLLGFVGKEAAYSALLQGGDAPGGPSTALSLTVLTVAVLGSALTVAYSLRFWFGAFGERRDRQGVPVEPTPLHRPSPAFVAVPLVLAAAGLLAAPVSELAEPWLAGYTDLFADSPDPVHLGLWHGLNPALALSALTLALGAGLSVGRRVVPRAPGAPRAVTGSDPFFAVGSKFLDRTSVEVTGAVQRGSLSLSLTLVLVVVVALPGGALLLGAPWSVEVRWWDSPAQPVVAAVVAVAAVLAARSRRRLRAVLLVGVTGYGTAMLFLLHGAPDLALTQVLVETLSLVVFVLVLRRLGSRFTVRTFRENRLLRAVLGILVGATVTGVALVASSARTATPDSVAFPEQAYEYGGGRNVVNVTLVDIRAWDTMGELSVVVAAAAGVASLVFLRRSERLTRRPTRTALRAGQVPPRWLVGGLQLPSERRSVVFEVVTRLLFHTIAVYSVYLLMAGHNQPGGGFAAGMVLGLALTVRYLAGGRTELAEAAPVAPGLLLGAGLFLSAGTGLAGLLLGGEVLQTQILQTTLPLLGDVKLVTSLFFDLGVYLVVIGMVLDVLRSLGAELDRQIEEGADDTDGEDGRISDDAPAPATADAGTGGEA